MSPFDPKQTSFTKQPFRRGHLSRYDTLPAGRVGNETREFISLLGGTAAAWPFAAPAQQAERMRLVCVFNILGSDDPEAQARRAVFEQTVRS